MNGTTQKVKWYSSNKKIATVSSKGKVTAKKAGKVTITAKIGKKKYTCKITVKNKPSLNKTKLTLEKGDTYTLKLTGTSSTPKWKTSDKSIVSISKKSKYTYKIKANKKGTAYVKVKVDGKELSCKIKVKKKLENPPVNSFCFDSYGNAYLVTSKDGKYKMYSQNRLNSNMKKKSIGKYKDLFQDKETEYYTLEKNSVFYKTVYLVNVTDTGYLRSTDGNYDSVSDDWKYINIQCYDLGGEIEINTTDLKWEISNQNIVKISHWQENYYKIIPLQPGKATVKVTFRDFTETFTINIGDVEQEAKYTYTIKDVSTNKTWYAGYGGKLLYIETKNPDVNSFEIIARGIDCDMDSSVNANVVYEDRHFSNWSSNSFTDKKNYYKAKDGNGYYVKVSTDEVGKVNFYIKEGSNTLTNTRLTVASIGGGKERYEQWLNYVEQQSITSSMTTLEKIDAVSTWLRENCYYPTCVYKDGEFFHEQYTEAPIWEVPTFDCLAAAKILASIVKNMMV